MATAQADLERKVRELGFEPLRSTGKHTIMRHPTAGSFPIPSTVGRGRGSANAVALAKRLVRQSHSVTTHFVDWLRERHGIAPDDRQRLRLTVAQEVEWFAAENKDTRINTSSLATMARQHPRVTPIPQDSKKFSVWEVAGRDWVAPEVVAVKTEAEVPTEPMAKAPEASGNDVAALTAAVEALQKHNDAVAKLDIVVTTLRQQRAELADLIALLEGH